MLKKTAVCAAMAACLAVGSLAGCGAKDGAGKADKSGANSAESSVTSSKYAYKPEFIDLKDEKINGISGFCNFGDEVIFVGDKIIGQKTEYAGTENEYTYDETAPEIYKFDINSKEITDMAPFNAVKVPDGMEGSSYISNMFKGEGDTFWTYEYLYTYSYDFPPGVDENSENAWEYYVEGENVSYLRQFDKEGNELKSIDTSAAGFEGSVESIEMDSKGNVYMSGWEDGIKVLDPDGNVKAEIPAEDRRDSSLSKIGPDKIGVTSYSEDYTNRTLNIIDPETGSFGEKIELPSNAYTVFQGFGDYDYCYYYNGKIYGHKNGAEEEKVLDWFDYDINSENVMKYTFLDNGNIIAYSSEWDESSQESVDSIILMNSVDAADVVQKEEIVLASLYGDYQVKDLALKFNRTSDKYRIVMKDYSEFNKDGDYSLGLTKLNTEIISGQVPDILVTSELPMQMYAAKGLLVDLWDYIDKDSEISRSDLMEHIFDVMSTDGKLYQVASNFGIISAKANKDIWGEETASIHNLTEKAKDLPEETKLFNEYMTRDEIVNFVIYMNMGELVDWNTGECHFDSPEFVEMLEFAKSFPEEVDWDNYEYKDENNLLLTGKQLLTLASVYDTSDFIQSEAAMGGKTVYVGTPGLSKGITGIYPGTGLAITTSCKNKDAAWEFVRTLLTEDYQKNNTWSLPTNKNVFDDKIKEAMTEEIDADGNRVAKSFYYDGSDNEIAVYAMTQEQVDKLMDLINSVDSVIEFDNSMQDIISDELNGFFNGEISAEETAKHIQSRVNLYVSEQK